MSPFSRTLFHRWSYGSCAAAAVVMLLIGIELLDVVTVSAHSELISSSPEPGAVLNSPPTEVVIEFSGPLAPASSIEVQDPNFRAMRASGAVTIDPAEPRVMRVPLKPLPDGSFTVQWLTVDPDDGHKTTGSYVFDVQSSNIVAPASDSQMDAGTPQQAATALSTSTPTNGPIALHENASNSQAGAGEGGRRLSQVWMIVLFASLVAGGILIVRQRNRTHEQ